jgi:transposase
MEKAKEISLEKRAQMKILAGQNMSHRELADILHVSKTAVTTGLARMKEVGSLQSRNRSGRPRVTTPASDRIIRRASVGNPSWSSKRIALELWPAPSSRTVRRGLLTE